MFESTTINHHIQKHIIDVLMYKEAGRFSELRPPKVDTNLFTYHLNALVKSSMVVKGEKGYSLSSIGLAYVDRVSTEKRTIRTQPKIITMLVIQNDDGKILLQRRSKQPYINAWTLPYGKLHVEDESVKSASLREAKEKLGLDDISIEHAGDCYIRVHANNELLSTTVAHVFRAYHSGIQESDEIVWATPHRLGEYVLAPAVEEIMTRTFFKDPFYFEEFDVDWGLETAVQ